MCRGESGARETERGELNKASGGGGGGWGRVFGVEHQSTQRHRRREPQHHQGGRFWEEVGGGMTPPVLGESRWVRGMVMELMGEVCTGALTGLAAKQAGRQLVSGGGGGTIPVEMTCYGPSFWSVESRDARLWVGWCEAVGLVWGKGAEDVWKSAPGWEEEEGEASGESRRRPH